MFWKYLLPDDKITQGNTWTQSFFCLEVKWIIKINYHFNDLVFISKYDTESIFFWLQGEQTAHNFLPGNGITVFSYCLMYHGFISLASVWWHLCRKTSPLSSCCLTWSVAFGWWWILKVWFHGIKCSVIEKLKELLTSSCRWSCFIATETRLTVAIWEK